MAKSFREWARSIKMPHTLVIVGGLVALVLLLSWIVPSGQFLRVEKVVEGALVGMMGSLDRNSSFISAADLEAMREDTKGEFEGIGVSIKPAEDGGIIGWVQRGDLKGPLDEAAFALGEGEVSGAIETEEGFHLVKVEKKEAAGLATLDDARKDIEPELRRAAAGEKFKKWMEDLRKRSKVQVFI